MNCRGLFLSGAGCPCSLPLWVRDSMSLLRHPLPLPISMQLLSCLQHCSSTARPRVCDSANICRRASSRGSTTIQRCPCLYRAMGATLQRVKGWHGPPPLLTSLNSCQIVACRPRACAKPTAVRFGRSLLQVVLHVASPSYIACVLAWRSVWGMDALSHLVLRPC